MINYKSFLYREINIEFWDNSINLLVLFILLII